MATNLPTVNRKRSATQRLAETLLGCDLAEWLHTTRYPTAGPARSYEVLAHELAARTSGTVIVSAETIRKWDLRFQIERVGTEGGAA